MSKRTNNSHTRRYGDVSRSGAVTSISAIVPPSQTLIYPVTETTDTSTDGGLTITMGQFVSIAHHGFEMKDRAGNVVFYEPPDGGPIGINGEGWRVYYAYGDTNYAAINSTSGSTLTSPFIELPDAGSGSGRGKMWGGQGAPSSSTVGSSTIQASVGDFYWRQRASGSLQVLYVCTVAGAPGTWIQVI